MAPPPSQVVSNTVNQYDAKVLRRSIDDPVRHHRRSSIPFADRKPAVRFIRTIEQRKRSISGPYDPKQGDTQRPILKKSAHPILVDLGSSQGEISPQHEEESEHNLQGTNEDMEVCRYRVEFIMDKLSRSERIGRGSVDILSFPTSTRRVEPLSRYQGCMTVCVCNIGLYTGTKEFIQNRKAQVRTPSMTEILSLIDLAQAMRTEAVELQKTAKSYLALAKKRYTEWETLLKRNAEFRVDQCKLKFPIYSNKKMPESVTLYEDALEEMMKTNYRTLEGYVRVCRNYPEGLVSLHCDFIEPNLKTAEAICYQDSSHDAQLTITKYVINHGKDLIFTSNHFLKHGIDILQDKDAEESFECVKKKLNELDYDEYFDPLCALDLKNAIGELVARKAELLNTAEQVLLQSKWLVSFTRKFYKFVRNSIKGTSACALLCLCDLGSPQKKLLQLLGVVSVEDITVMMPLTLEIAQDLFHMEVTLEEDGGGGEDNAGSGPSVRFT